MSVKVLLPDSWSLYPESSFVKKKKNAISNTSYGEGAAYSNPSLQNFQEILVNIMKFIINLGEKNKEQIWIKRKATNHSVSMCKILNFYGLNLVPKIL